MFSEEAEFMMQKAAERAYENRKQSIINHAIDNDPFFHAVKNRKVPIAPPDLGKMDHIGDSYLRGFCTDRGMWAMVYREWTDRLAQWIGDRRVLEIMAGYGWLARALADAGVSVIASDDGSWNKDHKKIRKPLYEIQQIAAIDAIHKFKFDVLICSWPPYGSSDIVHVADEFYHFFRGQDKDFVYIGESWGGCNAPQVFFWMFYEYEEQPVGNFMSWWGMHDDVTVGTIFRSADEAHAKLLSDDWYSRDYETDKENVYRGWRTDDPTRILVSQDGEYKEL